MSQAEKFLEAAEDDRLYTLFALALTSGMRCGEMLALEWGDFNFPGQSVQVQRSLEEAKGVFRVKTTKTAKGRRRIDLPKICLDALLDHRKAMVAEGHVGRCFVI